MEITGTLTQLKEFFEEWHSSDDDKFDTLHARLKQEINNIKSTANNNNAVLSENILALANLISHKLDGNQENITNLNSLNNITNKTEAQSSSFNLKDFNIRINALEGLPSIIGQNTSTNNKTIFQRLHDLEVSNLSTTNIDERILNFFKGKNIQSGDNLNADTYRTPGIYKCVNESIAASLTNCPVRIAFNLAVVEHEDRSVRQILTEYNNNEIWTRNYRNRTQNWSNWSKLYGTHNTTPFQMEVEFSNSTKTYTILATEIE